MLNNINHFTAFPDCIELKKSKLHGYGLFAAKNISAGYEFGISHVADERFIGGYIRTPLGAFINHSYTPNCVMPEDGDTYKLVCLKDISKGAELTVDYTPWYKESILKAFN